MDKTKSKKTRDPIATQSRILRAAKAEFARKGLGGARVDIIAAKSKANKRMLYHYFGNKDALFKITLEAAYADFRSAEAALQIEKDPPIIALTRLVEFTWQYYLANPEFINLVNSENLHKARHIKSSERMREISQPFVGRMRALLERGCADGLFRNDLDAVQVNITIAAIGYYYLTNQFTGSIVFERDLMSAESLSQRIDFNTKTVLRLVCTPETLEKIEARR